VRLPPTPIEEKEEDIGALVVEDRDGFCIRQIDEDDSDEVVVKKRVAFAMHLPNKPLKSALKKPVVLPSSSSSPATNVRVGTYPRGPTRFAPETFIKKLQPQLADSGVLSGETLAQLRAMFNGWKRASDEWAIRCARITKRWRLAVLYRHQALKRMAMVRWNAKLRHRMGPSYGNYYSQTAPPVVMERLADKIYRRHALKEYMRIWRNQRRARLPKVLLERIWPRRRLEMYFN
ncbi:hypothetical protein EV182_006640, partial [Spiromyces aspiralis]